MCYPSRLKTSKMGLLQKLTDFANETSIHGVMFMAQSTSSKSRRILWTILFMGSLIYATIQIKSIVECKLWNLYFFQDSIPSNSSFFCFSAWSKNPTLTIIETMTYPIEQVPFPAVTLCPQNPNIDRWEPTIKIFDYLKRRCPANQ